MFVIPIALNEIHIQHNSIKRIPPGIFPVMNSLLHLYLDYNNLTHLERGSFKGLLTLRTLSLGYNNISVVPWEALEDMSSLQYLYLHGNNLTKLGRKAFGNLPVVFELRLDHNHINNVTVNTFEGMLQLIKLNMSFNNISYIPPSTFQGLVSLRNLDISHNKISSLENKTNGILEDCLSLNIFNVSHNQMSFISERSFPKSPYIPYRITHIDLSNNFIPIITKTFDDGMRQVEILKLQNNILNEIRPGVLSNLTNIRHLDLSGNELQKLPKGSFGILEDMEELILRDNRLASFEVDEILSMTKLQLLDLRKNRFTSFYEELIPIMKENFTILFSGNLLSCDCHLRPLRLWMSNQPNTSQWDGVTCHEPTYLMDRSLPSLTLDDLTCKNRVFEKEGIPIKPDLQIRGSEILKDHGLRVVWYVVTREDVAGFKAVLRNMTGIQVVEEIVPYDKREYVFRDLEPDEEYQLCFRAMDSLGTEREAFETQCTIVGPVGGARRLSSSLLGMILPLLICVVVPLMRFYL
ncbi:protein artichoke [Caerostris darwini]|uniref:Protein artichoke n=1 Tax=Caerostris darwini TaxID=1538125 RepID=A0AAV4UTC5_9ARAC|nr:protein artichoke [Caerostris darwini]